MVDICCCHCKIVAIYSVERNMGAQLANYEAQLTFETGKGEKDRRGGEGKGGSISSRIGIF